MNTNAKPATDKPQIALIGSGAWGRHIARNLSELGALAAICDTHSSRAQEVAARHKVAVKPLPDIAKDSSIAGVAIATPMHSHAELAVAMLQAGKHIFVEKPLVVSLPDAKAIATAASKAKRQVMVGHLLRYHPAFLAMQDAVAQGRIGRVLHIDAKRLAPGRVRGGESVLYDLAPHDLALVYALTDGAAAESITCHAVRHIDQTIADVVWAGLQLAGGVSFVLQASWVHPVKIHCFTVIGEDGALLFDDTRPLAEKLWLYRNPAPPALPLTHSGEAVSIADTEPLRNEMSAFLAAVATNTPPPTDLGEALYVQEMLAALESTAQQTPPAKMRISPHAIH